MLKSYLLVALRNFSREKSYALINVLGLALAIASCILLFAYIESELSYDRHHLNHERIYRILNEIQVGGKTEHFSIVPHVLGPLFKKEHPDLMDYVRVTGAKEQTFKVGETEKVWKDVQAADANFFDVFTHKAIHGDLSTALEEPSSIAISESFAKAYFGDRNPIGETIDSDPFDYQITAVFADLPENSHLQYDAIITLKGSRVYQWDDENVTPSMLIAYSDVYTYFMTRANFTQVELERALQEYFERYAAETGKKFNVAIKFHPQPLKDTHFESGWDYDRPTGNIFYVYGAIAVALFLVLIACINYTNLATARASRRAKEVGIRRIMGAGRVQIGLQFIGESVVYTVVALMVASFLVYMVESYTPLSQLLGKSQLINVIQQPIAITYILLGALVVALLGGVYPALYLSSIAPLSVLAGTVGVGRSASLRQILVFVQFLVTVGVLSATMTMGLQLHYVANKPMGFEVTNRLAVNLQGAATLEQLPVIKSELLQISSVLGIAETNYVPGRSTPVSYVHFENNAGQLEPTTVNRIVASPEFVDVMDIEIVAGRNFSQRMPTDVMGAVLVNESLANAKGWENPIQKRVRRDDDDAQIVGVVKDFHFSSLHQVVEPMFIEQQKPTDYSQVEPAKRNRQYRTIVMEIAPNDISKTIEHIEDIIARFDKKPFEYHFLDDLLDELYEDDNNLLILTGLLSSICLFISGMGLYGLAAFTVAQRAKEIGIRKVLGASSNQIVVLLAKNLLLIIVAAATMGSIASQIAMRDWLNAFSYRTDIDICGCDDGIYRIADRDARLAERFLLPH